MAFGRRNDDAEDGNESRYTPEEWLSQAEKLAKVSNGAADLAARNAQVGAAKAIIALVYEQKRTNELLQQLLNK